MLAVLCLCLRVRHYLSVLVYAGLSLFIISGPYLYMVVCVLYAYNLTVIVSGILSGEKIFQIQSDFLSIDKPVHICLKIICFGHEHLEGTLTSNTGWELLI